MKALLIDDEQHNLDNLRALLQMYCPRVDICAAALNAKSATGLLYEFQPSLVFLDIQMPEQNGFEWLRSLPSCDFDVIFVTAYDHYAIQALRFAALDYLLKPVSIDELQTAVFKAEKKYHLEEQNTLLENLHQILKSGQTKDDQKIALSSAKETRFVKMSEIVRCESSNNYTTFYFLNAEIFLVCKPIYLYDDLLQNFGFIRCHQSHLVNKHYIKSWKKEFGDFLLMTDGSEVPISRTKRDVLKKALYF
jgi:two-component system LytT family response regulator